MFHPLKIFGNRKVETLFNIFKSYNEKREQRTQNSKLNL